MSKDTYKLSNWPQYNEGLKQRGALTIWIHQKVLSQWYYQGKRKRGGKQRYSDGAIQVCLVVRKVYHLALRQTQGFIRSFFKQMQLSLAVPDYTVICRRSSGLSLKVQGTKRAITDVVMDSTGLKLYGAGEWVQKKQGRRLERTWMKLHVALDEHDQQVRAVCLTTNHCGDAQVAGELLEQIDGELRSLKADGAYDKRPLRKQLYQKGILQIIPPHSASVVDHTRGPYLDQRNEDVAFIQKHGKPLWKELTNYHQRSKAETFMFRYKTIIGEKLQARTLAHQQSEALISCNILNTMLTLAKPISYRVA